MDELMLGSSTLSLPILLLLPPFIMGMDMMEAEAEATSEADKETISEDGWRFRPK